MPYVCLLQTPLGLKPKLFANARFVCRWPCLMACKGAADAGYGRLCRSDVYVCVCVYVCVYVCVCVCVCMWKDSI